MIKGRSQTTFTRRGRCIGGPKMSTFCQRSYHRKCQRRGEGGQKRQNLVNAVCERPLNSIKLVFYCFYLLFRPHFKVFLKLYLYLILFTLKLTSNLLINSGGKAFWVGRFSPGLRVLASIKVRWLM